MHTPETGRFMSAKLRGDVEQSARRPTLAPAGQVKAGTALVRITAQRTYVLDEEVGLALERSESGSDEFRRQLAELLVEEESDQDVGSMRRGDGQQQTTYEILNPVGSPSPGNDADANVAAVSPDSLSAFVARVLDQLSLSAWFPAALFTVSLAIFLQFRRQGSDNLARAIRVLTADPVRVLVIMIPILVIATVVTQAFSFEAIRTLEGYWRRRGPASLARTLMIRRQVRRRKIIAKRLRKAYEKAFTAAKRRMADKHIPERIITALQAQVVKDVEMPILTEVESSEFTATNWRSWCDPWLLAKVDQLLNEEEAYPINSRILPTKLGNLIRATEDQLLNTGDDVQGFALRRYSMAPPLVQAQHDQYRNRLEMYCVLVFVSASLAALTPVILIGHGISATVIAIMSGSFAALCEASYLAALASAEGYCSALKVMDEPPQSSIETDEELLFHAHIAIGAHWPSFRPLSVPASAARIQLHPTRRVTGQPVVEHKLIVLRDGRTVKSALKVRRYPGPPCWIVRSKPAPPSAVGVSAFESFAHVTPSAAEDMQLVQADRAASDCTSISRQSRSI
jgi:hypothetical protein